MTQSLQFTEELEFSKQLIKEAGELALIYFKKELMPEFKEDFSIVTEADKVVERFIRTSLIKKFPPYGFIGEETEEHHQNTLWIVDPIDGTVAFTRGISAFGMALALVHNEEIIFSIIYIPYNNLLYHAYKDKGSYENERRIFVSKESNIKNAIISLHGKSFGDINLHDHLLKLLCAGRPRMTHSVAVESTYLASGKIDVLTKYNQHIWDVVPEYLLMLEAGAVITDEFGKPLSFNFRKGTKYNFLASNKELVATSSPYLYLSK